MDRIGRSIKVAHDFVGNPWLVGICFLVLLADWWSLPNQPNARATAAAYWPWNSPYRGAMHGFSLPVWIYRTPDGLRADSDLGPPEPPETWRRVPEVHLLQDMVRRDGFWGMTRETFEVKIIGEQALTPEERALVPHLVVGAIESIEGGTQSWLKRSYDRLKSGTLRESRTRWPGCVHNAFAIALATIVALGSPSALVRIVRGSIAAGRDRIAEDRLARGHCPHCGYDLKGNTAISCPECGRAPSA